MRRGGPYQTLRSALRVLASEGHFLIHPKKIYVLFPALAEFHRGLLQKEHFEHAARQHPRRDKRVGKITGHSDKVSAKIK